MSYDDYSKKPSNTTSNKDSKEYKVGYFSLKDDGDEAIVRFGHASPREINIVTVHTVKVTNKDGKELYKRVSCLREVNDPTSKCPFCVANSKTQPDGKKPYPLADKFYVKLIEYIKDEKGNIVSKARVWERPAKFARELKSFMDEYGDLTNFVFKVKRQGNRGSMETTYSIIPARQDVYKPEVYVKDFSDFEGFKMAGSFYMVKTAEEISTFLTTGDFPIVQSTNKSNPVPAPAVSQPVAQPADQPSSPTTEQKGPANPTEGRPQRYTF